MLCAVLAVFAIAVRFYCIAEPHQVTFDEVLHAAAARSPRPTERRLTGAGTGALW